MSFKVKCYTWHGVLGTYDNMPAAEAKKESHETQFPDCDVDIIGSQHWRLINENEKIVNLFRTKKKAQNAKKVFELDNPGMQLKIVRIKPE